MINYNQVLVTNHIKLRRESFRSKLRVVATMPHILRPLFLACFIFLYYFQNVSSVDTKVEDYGRHLFMSAVRNVIDSLPEVAERLRQEPSSLADTSVSDKCKNDSDNYINQLLSSLIDTNTPAWVLKLFDATGKPPTGILDGNLQWLGSYTECLKVRMFTDNSSTELGFQGKYCTATIGLLPTTESSKQKNPIRNGKTPTMSLNALLGICWPSSCNETEITELLLSKVLVHIPISNLAFEVINGTCHIDEPRKFDHSAIAVIIVYSIFALLMVMGTIYEVVILWRTDTEFVPLRNTGVTTPRKSLLERILVSFSVYKNGKKLLSMKQGEGTLTCIHGIRFFSMAWVVLGHTYSFAMQMPVKNLAVVTDVIRDIFFDTIVNGTFSVDTFFFLSGFLVAYLFLKEMKKTGGDFGISKIALFYFHRYWRLTPPFALGIAFVSTLLTHISTGPNWQEQNVQTVDNCRTYWWRSILYIHNLYDQDHMCYAVSWYLGCDMQFYLVSLLIIYPLYKMQKLGLGILSLFFIGTAVAPALIIYTNDLPALLLGDVGAGFNNPDDADKTNKYMQLVYMVPWCRMGPYLVGISLALFLYKTELKVKMHTLLVFLGWIVAAVLGLVLVYGTHPYFTGDSVMSKPVNTLYGAFSRTAWGVMLAWVVFACVTGHGGYVNTILSWKGLIPLSRLTYSTYLVHWYVMIAFFLSQESTYFFNHYLMTLLFLGFLVVSMGVGFVFSLAFEAPLLELEKIFLPSRGKRREPQKHENGSNKRYGTYTNDGFQEDGEHRGQPNDDDGSNKRHATYFNDNFRTSVDQTQENNEGKPMTAL